MTYIGYTKIKKIKKLCLLSREIIHTYGLRYFLYIVKLELKKQGFRIFTPDIAPQPSFSQKNYQNEYNEYLRMMHNSLSKKYTNDSKVSPTVKIILLFDGDQVKLQLTMNSLQKQHYLNWQAVLLPINFQASKEIIKINDSHIFQKFGFTENDQKLNELLLSSPYDLICIIKTGDLLDEYALSVSTLNHQYYDIIYSDHDVLEENLRTYPFFKPDWSPYLFRSMDFMSPFCMIKSEIFNQIKFDAKFLNCLQYDVLLKCVEITNKISHISLPLCSTQKQFSENDCDKTIMQNHLNRIKILASVKDGIVKNTLRINYKLNLNPKISILIPTKNNFKILKRCIESIEKKTNYSNKEIIIIDNNSDDQKIQKYYDKTPYKVVSFQGNFNFSKMNNLATSQSTGDLLLFLNDDTKVLEPNWLDELVSICMQNDVGAVGSKLIFSDDTIQHAGMVFLNTGAGFHPGMRLKKNTDAYHNIVNVMRDYSAVTGACLLVKKDIFDKIGGFDDKFDVYYGDSDLCLKIIAAGYRVIYTPFSELLHEGSLSIQSFSKGTSFFDVENHQRFIKKWPHLKNGDPYYNSNLDWDYSIRKNPFDA